MWIEVNMRISKQGLKGYIYMLKKDYLTRCPSLTV
jgi:hypothetical protein